MTAVIEASSAGVRDMSDGSLRITFEFEPRHAAEAFALFGPRGRAVAIAALKDGAAAVSNSVESHQIAEKPKGGAWAKLAGIWCNSPHFHAFLNQTYPEDDHVENSQHAAMAVRAYCGIESRAELDSSSVALSRFNELLRRPFMQWMKVRGVEIDQREHA